MQRPVVILIALLTVTRLPLSWQQKCQRGRDRLTMTSITSIDVCTNYTVAVGVRDVSPTVSPVAYNGIQPDTTGCVVGERFLQCDPGQGVLGDGDIGPTHSVDLSDPDQSRGSFVWHRDNGSVALSFRNQTSPPPEFTLSYIDIYTLTVPSARIGPPNTTTVSGINSEVTTTYSERCTFYYNDNTLSRNIIHFMSQTQSEVIVRFEFNEDTDWMFISEIILCSGDPPSPITCGDECLRGMYIHR